jgi:hypothetical protein
MGNTIILERLYHLCGHDFDQMASEIALKYLEHELSAGNFEAVDALLVEADVKRLSLVTLLTIITITGHGKGHLPHRLRFLERVEQKMELELGKERTRRLLELRR